MPDAKILIVDDTKANLVAMKALLKSVEATLIEADSGEEAIRAAQVHTDHLALILLDVQMPEIDGFEVARLLNEIDSTRSIPIVFTSGGSPWGAIWPGVPPCISPIGLPAPPR